MSSKPLTKVTFLIAVLALFSGAVSASAAGFNFGTVYVGDFVVTSFVDGNPFDEPAVIDHISMPFGFLYGNYTYGTIYVNSTYYVDIHVDTGTPGSHSGYMLVYLRTTSQPYSYHTEAVYLTVNIIEPCDPLSVSITGPTQGSTKTPNAAGNVILQASASSSADRVEFYVDGALVANDLAPSWAYAWPAKDGSHQVYAKAYDTCGNSLTSSSVSFSVNCGNPSVTLTKPVNGSTVTPNAKGNVILEATASHSTGIQRVRFFIDGGLVATDTVAPYAYAWPATSGTHLARARAFSNCGGAGVSSNAATFTVP